MKISEKKISEKKLSKSAMKTTMKTIMKSAEIRSAFLKYFESKQHQVVPSSSLIPVNDPTLLFINAGMVQFKDVFLGKDLRSYTRATTSQRVVRAGGKHNDLENVGYTARHHTFFEMLGNFSFGDYFKSEAIAFAWEFLTQILKLPAEKLWVTVYQDDTEAEKIWFEEVGIDPQRFSRLGKKDNFWSMGDTGPCGPCSEIFYDHGESVPGGPPGSSEEDGDRYIEIWNLVFMQYDRKKGGELVPLPKPSVDTGMGLERIAAVMQGVHNNYDIDLFENLIHAIAEITGTKDKSHQSLRVIADHIRACSFLICDSIVPSNEGRGYVLRRIIRRALRHGSKLGISQPFFHRCVDSLVTEMGIAYPELAAAQKNIEKILKHEEEQFAITLEQGLKILEQDIHDMDGRVISGETLFSLYDTYGFPVDLTADIARERNLELDMFGFEQKMKQQKARSKLKNQFDIDDSEGLNLQDKTLFSGYDRLEDESKISAIYVAGKKEDVLTQNQEGVVVLEQTPFYAESGGQVGDSGFLRQNDAVFQVLNTTKDNQAFIHRGRVLQGAFKVGNSVQAEVDQQDRLATARNHSVTHLLHAALRKVLGSHVIQKGSLVDPEKIRFDFSHLKPVTPEELLEIEALVNAEIRANTLVTTEIMDIESAKSQGALALFGEKYDEKVRVLSMGVDHFSVELCGGTHVQRTGDIGLFKLIAETGIASGVRRIDALTGEKALDRVNQIENQQRQLAVLLKAQPENLIPKLESSLEKQKQLEKTVQKMQSQQAASAGTDLLSSTENIAGIKVLRAQLEGVDSKNLRELMDQLKNKLHSGVILLATSSNGKVQLAAGVTSDLMKKYSAGDLVKEAAAKVGGKGGGRPDMAMAGGNQPENIAEALAVVEAWLVEKSNNQ